MTGGCPPVGVASSSYAAAGLNAGASSMRRQARANSSPERAASLSVPIETGTRMSSGWGASTKRAHGSTNWTRAPKTRDAS